MNHHFSFEHGQDGVSTTVTFVAECGVPYDEVHAQFLRFLSMVYGYDITIDDVAGNRQLSLPLDFDQDPSQF